VQHTPGGPCRKVPSYILCKRPLDCLLSDDLVLVASLLMEYSKARTRRDPNPRWVSSLCRERIRTTSIDPDRGRLKPASTLWPSSRSRNAAMAAKSLLLIQQSTYTQSELVCLCFFVLLATACNKADAVRPTVKRLYETVKAASWSEQRCGRMTDERTSKNQFYINRLQALWRKRAA